MAYGNTTTIQQLLWGGVKASVPGNVSAANDEATTIINLVLNRNDDFSTVPTHVERIANMIAAEIVRTPMVKREEIINMSKLLLSAYMDQAPPTQSNWGNVWWV